MWIKAPVVEDRRKHILIFHSKCQRSYRDFYLADVILALLRSNMKVTMCTTKLNEHSPLMSIENENDNMDFLLPWKYLPTTLFGCLSKFFLQLKVMWLILKIILLPPFPRPSLIISDTNTTVLSLLKMMTSYKVVFINHFSHLHSGEFRHTSTSRIPPFVFANVMRNADKIIVQTKCLQEMLERYLPSISNKLTVLNPCYDTGFWMYEPLEVRSIMPMLTIENFLFVTFGEFKPRTNLWLVLKSLDYIFRYMETTFSVKVHLVIAGYSEPISSEEDTYLKNLQEVVGTKLYSNNVTFLKQTTVLEQKTLIENCTAVLSPANYDVFPGSILMTMNMRKPIISVISGFAKNVLKNNDTGFLLSNNPTMFATKMEELAKNPLVGKRVAENAKREFDENYSFRAFSQHLNEIVNDQLNS